MSDSGVQCVEERGQMAIPEHGEDIHMMESEHSNHVDLRAKGPGKKINIYQNSDNLSIIGLQQDGLQKSLTPNEASSIVYNNLKDAGPNSIGFEPNDDLETDGPGDSGGTNDGNRNPYNFREQTGIRDTGPYMAQSQPDLNQSKLPPKKRRSQLDALKPIGFPNNSTGKSPRKEIVKKFAPYKIDVPEHVWKAWKETPGLMEVNGKLFEVKPVSDFNKFRKVPATAVFEKDRHDVLDAGTNDRPPDYMPPPEIVSSSYGLHEFDKREEYMPQNYTMAREVTTAMASNVPEEVDMPMDLSVQNAALDYTNSALIRAENKEAMSGNGHESCVTSSFVDHNRERFASIDDTPNQESEMENLPSLTRQVDDLRICSPLPTESTTPNYTAKSGNVYTPEKLAAVYEALGRYVKRQKATSTNQECTPPTVSHLVQQSQKLAGNMPIPATVDTIKTETSHHYSQLAVNQAQAMPGPLNGNSGIKVELHFLGQASRSAVQSAVSPEPTYLPPQMPNLSDLDLANDDGSLLVTYNERLKMKLKSQLKNKTKKCVHE